MSITGRILLWLALLVIAAVVVIGATVVTTTRTAMIDQLDETIAEAADRPAGPPAADLGGSDEAGEFASGGRAVAVLEFGPDGTLIVSSPSGFADDPDPLPDLADPSTLLDGDGQPTGPQTVDAIGDSSLRYRVVASASPPGITVAAAPMDAVDDTTRTMIIVLTVVGSFVVVVVLAGAYLVIKRGLRPVYDIADTARELAAGDLSSRTPHDDPRTEVGQLGASFNHMADEVQASIVEREANAERLKRFVADASHELRTPLVSVRGYAELYRAGALVDGTKLAEAMDRIEGETKRMGRLIDDLLTLARLDQRQQPEFRPVDLVALGSDAVDDARAVEPDRAIDFKHDERVTVDGDADRLRQVFGNLLTNARVHTPPGTPIEVVVRTDGERCRISVSDEGPGIEPAQLEHVFERFYRADKARSRRQGGTGLGLSIVAAVAAAHGGEASVESTVDEGTTFIIALPRSQRGTQISAIEVRSSSA